MSRPTVVLVAHGVHDEGGMERSLAELVRHAHERVRFHLVTTRVAQDVAEVSQVTRLPLPGRPVPAFFASFYAAASAVLPRVPGDLRHCMGAICAPSADLVSVQFCHAAYSELAIDLQAVDGSPTRQLNRRLDRGLSLAAERHGYRPSRVRRFAAASEGVRRELARHYPGIPAAVVPNGFDPLQVAAGVQGASQLRVEHGLEGRVVALFLGGDWRRKGLREAIEGLAHARRLGATDLHLLVVGRGDREQHEAAAERLGVRDAVTFAGPTAVPASFFAASDLFVFPTAYEAFPLVALEAAAHGLPIVATAVNGIEELVRHGLDGLLVDRDGAAVGEALHRLAGDPGLRARMSESVRRHAQAYTWKAAAEGTLDLYDELL